MKSLLFGLIALVFALTLQAGPRDAHWAQVEAARKAGLPQSAIEALEYILTAALAERAYPEALKALGQKIALEGITQGNKPEEKITRVLAALETVPVEMKPLMHALLGHWYWSYFRDNRWRFSQRTVSMNVDDSNLETWDLRRILTEVDRQFQAALNEEERLKSIPINAFDGLIDRGNVPNNYRPTLYDFLANEALIFYQAGEQGGIAAEDEFAILADGPVFADTQDFMGWALPPSAQYSPKRQAVLLFQRLLRFHVGDADRTAHHDLNLARLEFARNFAVGENVADRYAAAMERLAIEAKDNEVSAAVYAAMSKQQKDKGCPITAHALALKGRASFPNSIGARRCENLIIEIKKPELSLGTERVWNASGVTLDITYKNCAKVYFRAIALDLETRLKDGRPIERTLGGFELADLLKKKPALAWEIVLPATPDFLLRKESFPAPVQLAPGPYVICASSKPGFDTNYFAQGHQVVWVSNLALVWDDQRTGSRVAGYVLDAVSGEPVVEAEVQAYRHHGVGWLDPQGPLVKTDRDGRFEIERGWAEKAGIVHARARGHDIVSELRRFYSYDEDTAKPAEYTLLFTDRVIYRPRQTVFYKALCARTDARKGEYEVLDGEHVTVILLDTNDEVVARAQHRTNDYGSFSGSFVAPSGERTGEMKIAVEKGPRGRVEFRVEEYKRPKFEITWHKPSEAPKLGSVVRMGGKAAAYSGAAIDGAHVTWRAVRETSLPRWCWWWSQGKPSKAIAHGTAVTQADGSFVIEFIAEPDLSIPTKDEPVFSYTVSANVTALTGETRSEETTVRVGYAALEAAIWADSWQTTETPVLFRLATRSYDEVGQSAPLKLKVRALRQPERVQRAALNRYVRTAQEKDLSDPQQWPEGNVVTERSLTTDLSGRAQVEVVLPVGYFRVFVEAQDRFGKTVTTRETVRVLDPRAKQFAIRVPEVLAAPTWSVEPGETFTAFWSTGYESGRALIEFWCAGKLLQRRWTSPGQTQEKLSLAITDEMRGGVTLRTMFVRENRLYENNKLIEVLWSDRELDVRWERFRSKLLPGQKETWTAVISGSKAEQVAAEMVASMYDASLDQFLTPAWPKGFGGFREEYGVSGWSLENDHRSFGQVRVEYMRTLQNVTWEYPRFAQMFASFAHWQSGLWAVSPTDGDSTVVYRDGEEVILLSPFSVNAEADVGYAASATLSGSRTHGTNLLDEGNGSSGVVDVETVSLTAEKLNRVTARKDFNETAFFYPHLETDEDGEVRISFKMPEALTTWRFLAFAHDKELRSAFFTDKAVTAKDLMVEPNPPRFVREGDAIEFTVKVSNQSDQPQTGKVKLTFADAASQQSVDAALGNTATEQTFEVPAKQSRSFAWRIAVPDGAGFLTYKAVGATAQASDGEEGFLPVLSRRVLVTESLPLPIRGAMTRAFAFNKLIESGKSDTLRHQSLTVQMTSQPAWYAVMALPYLMEFPHACSEQLFNRLYANALARHIAHSDPNIRRVFDLWKNTPALDSPLIKNQDLKSVLIEETPWLRQAGAQSEARRNVGLLFDANRLDAETASTLHELAQRQTNDGLWAWFPGGRSSEYISLYVATGFGRLRQLGVEIDVAPALKALGGLDAWMAERHREILRQPKPQDYVPSYLDAFYLYGRSLFLQERPIAKEHREAVDFFLRQSRAFWLKLDSRQSHAHLALGLKRFGDKETPLAIMKSLKERSVNSEELGMFWRDSETSWWWHRAPIETQAMMIEAFSEVAQDKQAVEDCKVWLLKQKQTQDWKTTKATADAIYALLLRGGNLLSSDALVEVSLGGRAIKPEKVEVGTGFYEQKFARDEIKPAMGNVAVKKTDSGVSWGSVHWQYLEDIGKVTPHEGTPLKLRKTLFIKETTKSGPVLKPVSGPVAVGDELVVRIELRSDRDMEYVHLKDQRGSGTEPVNVLSRYRWQDGLGYYESTRDTASHWYIEYLPKGTYVFEYSTRVQLKGRYQTGIAEIQCMYAPEFNSHSASMALEVK